MSIFGKIMSAIFGGPSAATTVPGTASAAPDASGAAPAGGGTATATMTAPMSQVDVEAVLTNLAANNKEKLDWRKSIVDLMKLLNLDSGLGARKQLAKELGYTGALDGSAEMNVWLHKQVMTKLAESGGKVPDSLKT